MRQGDKTAREWVGREENKIAHRLQCLPEVTWGGWIPTLLLIGHNVGTNQDRHCGPRKGSGGGQSYVPKEVRWEVGCAIVLYR